MAQIGQGTTATTEFAGLDGGAVSVPAEQLHDLDARIEGRLLHAGDDGWDDAALVWNAMVASRPAMVVQPTGARTAISPRPPHRHPVGRPRARSRPSEGSPWLARRDPAAALTD